MYFDKKNGGAFIPNYSQYYSAGVYTKPEYSYIGGGLIAVSEGEYVTFISGKFETPLIKYYVPELVVELQDQAVNFVVFCNDCDPKIYATTDREAITQSNVVPIFTLYRDGDIIHELDWGVMAKGLSNKISDRLVRTQRFVPEPGGLALGGLEGRYITITGGYVRYGITRQRLADFTSQGTEFYFYYHSGGLWTYSNQTAFNNQYFDNGNDLESLSGGSYAVNRVFRGVERDSHVYVVTGREYNNLASAKDATIPVLPDVITYQAILVGRIIVKQGDDVATEIDSAFETSFNSSPIYDHTILSNLSRVNSGHSGTAKTIPFFDSSGNAYNNINFVWDNSFNRLGIGLNSPLANLDVYGNTRLGRTINALGNKVLTICGNTNIDRVKNPTNAQTIAMTVTNNGAGSIPAGTYYYGVMFTTDNGDTGVTGITYSTFPSITSATPFRSILNNIPVSADPRVTGRKIYRSQAGTVGDFYYLYLIGTIPDNTTTTFNDNTVGFTSTDWIYNKNNTTGGITYLDNSVYTRLADYVTAFGNNAFASLTRGSTCAAFGSSALVNCTTGDSNQAFGHSSSSSITTGSSNCTFGYAAGQGNQTGNGNCAFGQDCLRNNLTQSYSGNSAFGTQALGILTASNNYNSGFGYGAGYNAQGNYGTYLGYYAGRQPTATTVGSSNIAIGYNAGTNLGTGGSNVVIGASVGVPVSGTSNQLNIGNIIYGINMGTGNTPSATGKVGIGVVIPSERLEVDGNIKATGYKSSDGSSGANGTFTTVDGKTITVKNGLITNIV